MEISTWHDGIFLCDGNFPFEFREVTEENNALPWEDAFVYVDSENGGSAVVDRNHRLAATLKESDLPGLFKSFHNFVETDVQLMLESATKIASLTPSETHIVRYSAGGFFKPHRDTSRKFWRRCFTVILYLSDCIGGETEFPDHDLAVKPKPGRLLIFPSEYLHAARPVVSGEKYLIATWLITKPAIWKPLI